MSPIGSAGTIRKVTITGLTSLFDKAGRRIPNESVRAVLHGATPDNDIFKCYVQPLKFFKIQHLKQLLNTDLLFKEGKGEIWKHTFADPGILSALTDELFKSGTKNIPRTYNHKPLFAESKLSFAFRPTDAMFYAKVSKKNGKWNEWNGGLTGFSSFLISPAAVALNYGQSGFEGLKARYNNKGKLTLFRVESNGIRMQSLAERLCMAPVPVKYFVEAVKKTVLANKAYVPKKPGNALYIRPLLFGSGEKIGVGPADEYTFLIYVSPVGGYFKKDAITPVDLYMPYNFHRSGPGMTGNVKAAGNYVGGMLAKLEAQKMYPSISELLYLDVNNKVLDEVGTSNVFCVKDGVFYTPSLTKGTILPGITRDSIIKIAKILGYQVIETDITLNLLGEAQEAFSSGTAVGITPIGNIHSDDGVITFNGGKTGPLTKAIYDYLNGVYMGTKPDPANWITKIEEK